MTDKREDVAQATPDELQKRSVADAVGGYILAQKKRGRSSIPMDELDDVRASITDAFTFYRCIMSLHHPSAPQNRDVGWFVPEAAFLLTLAAEQPSDNIGVQNAKHLRAIAQKISTPPSVAGIPDGWQLVPKTPTLEMLSIFAGVDFIESAFNNLPLAKQKAERDAYAKMLAVAPPLPFPDLSEIWREAFENLWDAAKEVHTLGASQGGQWSQLALALEQSSKFISASPSPVVDAPIATGERLEAEEKEMFRLADRLGYVCTPEPQHPDSPHVQEQEAARIAIKDEAREEDK